jgi:hypothetical protein
MLIVVDIAFEIESMAEGNYKKPNSSFASSDSID